MQYRQPFLDYRNIFSGKSALSRIIIINAAVWIGINLIKVILYLFRIDNSDIVNYLGVPSDIDILLNKPWTLITYMFTHEDFFHILFNMLMLYFGGLIFTEYLNEKKLVGTYLIGGLTGALFFIVSYNIFPVFSGMVSQAIAIGASASVLAVFFAIATYVPDYTAYLLLIGRIKLIYIALIFLVIDLLSINKGNPGGHLAHLGGALWGFVYILLLKRGYDFLNIFNTFRSIRNPFRLKKKSRFKIEYTRNGRPLTDDEYNEMRAKRQKLLDEILEKIAKNGYDCLSKEEKEFLFRKSSE